MEAIVDFDTIGPDLSVGEDHEIYSKSATEVETELLLKVPCPKEVTPRVRDGLIAAVVDVCSLPGMLSMVENYTL